MIQNNMLNFKKLNLEESHKIISLLKNQDYKTCDYTFCTTYMYRNYFSTEYAIFDDTVIFKVNLADGRQMYTIPVGKKKLKESIAILENICLENGTDLDLCMVPSSAYFYLKKRYGGNLKEYTNRDFYDYLYFSQDIINLKGKRYHGQRNHINRFLSNHPDYEFVLINSDNIMQIRNFYLSYISIYIPDGKFAEVEKNAVFDVLDNFDMLDLFGAFIKADGKIISFSIGEIQNDTLFVHIEKAYHDVPGAYQITVNQFAKTFGADITYINREDDAGIEGLRKSKLSYHPTSLLEKYSVHITL